MNPDTATTAPFTLELEVIPETESPPGVNDAQLAALAAFVLRSEGAAGNWEVNVALVDDDRLQALHRDFMGVDAPTDIMTFTAGESAGLSSSGGELAISVDHARTQAAAWGHTPAEEIRFLLVHGLLHLLGWTDETDEERGRMLQRQQNLIATWEKCQESG